MSYNGSLLDPDFFSVLEVPTSSKENSIVMSNRYSNLAMINHQHTGDSLNDGELLYKFGDSDGTVLLTGLLGKLGILNSTPRAKLHIGNSTVDPTDIATSLLYLSAAGTVNFNIRNTTDTIEFVTKIDATSANIGTYTNHPLYIKTNNTAVITVLGNGNVGIGISPTSKLHISGTGNITGTLSVGGVLTAATGITITSGGQTITSGNLVVSSGTFSCSGDATMGGVSWATHRGDADAHHDQIHTLDSTNHTGTLSWTKVNKTGSSLADLVTRNHSSLQNSSSGDDHTQYVLIGGRAAGQILYGGNVTGTFLALYGNSADFSPDVYIHKNLIPNGIGCNLGNVTYNWDSSYLNKIYNVTTLYNLGTSDIVFYSNSIEALRVVNNSNSPGIKIRGGALVTGIQNGSLNNDQYVLPTSYTVYTAIETGKTASRVLTSQLKVQVGGSSTELGSIWLA